MRKLIITALLTMCASISFAQTPILPYVDKTVNGQQETMTIYSYPKYYDNNGSLETVDTNIVASNDVGWDWEVKKGVYKLRVKNDGTFEINHLGDVIQQKVLGLVFWNQATKERLLPAQTQFTLSNPTVNGNAIEWSLPQGSTYRIEYVNNNLKDIITISNPAKVWLKNNKPGTWQIDDIWVGIVYDIDTSGSTMIQGNDIETDGDIGFISGGRVKHKIRSAWAKHSTYQDPVYDADDNVINPDESSRIWKRRRIIKDGKYVEAIKAIALDSVSGELIFNTDVTFQEGVSGYSGTEDAYLDAANTTTNYETATALAEKDSVSGTGDRHPVIRWDISSIPDTATIDAASVSLEINHQTTGWTTHVHALLRDWVEAEVTWNIWKTSNNWTTAGAKSNGNDVDGVIKSSTGRLLSYAHSNESAGTVIEFASTSEFVTYVQDQLTSDKVDLMFTQDENANIYITFDSSEATATEDRPLLSVTYTDSGGGGGGGSQVIFISKADE